jgi:hypothetical protein
MPVRLFSRRVANIYSDPNTGSGDEFRGVESRYQAVLEEWPLEAKDINKLTMGVIGNLSNVILGPLHQESAAFRVLVAQNIVEVFAFLMPALSAGFVEEFVFRGYLQRQFQALCSNGVVGSVLQVIVFSLGHYYQGWIRLVPVALIGTLLTIVAYCSLMAKEFGPWDDCTRFRRWPCIFLILFEAPVSRVRDGVPGEV